jgi:hypothetical protein
VNAALRLVAWSARPAVAQRRVGLPRVDELRGDGGVEGVGGQRRVERPRPAVQRERDDDHGEQHGHERRAIQPEVEHPNYPNGVG